jgi:hypothetical protein
VASQVVPDLDVLLPLVGALLDDVGMVRPWPRHATAKQHLVRQPLLVLDHLAVTEPDEPIRQRQPSLLQASHGEQEVDDWLGGQARHRGAPDVLDRDRRTQGHPQPITFLFELRGPAGIVVTDVDRPAAVLLPGRL